MAQQRGPTQLRKGALELAILTLLAKDELYGGALVEQLGNYPGLAAPAGTVYPLLTRLAKNELVTTRWQESQSGPPRKYYSLTKKGQQMRNQLAEDFNQIATDITTLLQEGSVKK